jgi:hypothetical protein
MSEPHPAVAAILTASPLVALGGSDGEAARIAAAVLRWAAENVCGQDGGCGCGNLLDDEADKIEGAR